MSNKMTVVEYYDADTCDSIKLACQAYGIQILAEKPIESSANEIYACVYGPTENVDRFVEDLNNGDLEPFEATRDMSDNEYQEWLETELKKFGCNYVAKHFDDEDENIATTMC